MHSFENGVSENEASLPLAGGSELEALAILAIRQNVRMLEADEILYEQWARAHDNPLVPRDVVQCLQNEYLMRAKAMQAMQTRLSEIIDALGRVPDIHNGDDLAAS